MTVAPVKPSLMPSQVALLLEHTLLGDDISQARMISHLDEALQLGLFAVCVPPSFVPLAKKHLAKTSIKVVTVVDFPLGARPLKEKAMEAKVAADLGADEIDMVLDYQAVIEARYAHALAGINAVTDAAADTPVKVIIETSALNQEQKIAAITLVGSSRAHFIKTSTGFHTAGAMLEDIELMKRLLPSHIQIKASGGIKTLAQAVDMINAGATRIGTSKSREILKPN